MQERQINILPATVFVNIGSSPASPIAEISWISRQSLRSVVVKQAAWRLVTMGNVDPKSGGVSNVEDYGYAYGRQILDPRTRKLDKSG